MSNIDVLRSYLNVDPTVASAAAVPSSITPDAIRMALSSTRKKAVINPIGSQSQSQGGMFKFQLPYGLGSDHFLKAGSVYLRGKLAQTGQSTGSFGFAGSVPNASRMIRNLQVSYAGQLIEDIQQFNEFSTDIYLPYIQGKEYANLASSVSGGLPFNNYDPLSYTQAQSTGCAQVDQNSSFAHDATPIVEIPLFSSFLQGGKSMEMIPLFCMSSPLEITLQLDTAVNSLVGSTTGMTNFTLSEVELRYSSVNPSRQYIDALIQGMSGGKTFAIDYTTINSFKTALTASLSVNQSVNAKSVRAVAISTIPATEQAINARKRAQAPPNAVPNSTLTTKRIFFDNLPLVNYPDSLAQASDNIMETVEAVYGNVYDKACGNLPFSQIGSVAQSGNYLSTFHSTIIGSDCYNDADIIMTGTPCNVIRYDLTYQGAASGDIANFYCFVEKVAFFGLGTLAIQQ
jgi:hypothetical protein